MEFIELKEKEFDAVCNNYECSSFYQTSNWAKLKNANGWNYYYVGVKDNNKIVACSLILSKKLFLNKHIFYSPRGLLLDYKNKELLNFFINELKKFIKRKNGIVFKIDPLIKYQNHDKNGNVIENNFSNKKIINDLTDLKFKHRGFTVGYSDEAQFRWSYCLDLGEKLDDLTKDMDQRCRRCLKKYKKYPLEIIDINDDNIKDFKAIMEHTAKRQNHFDRTLNYYKNIKEYFKNSARLVIVYLNKEKFLEEFQDDKLYETIKKFAGKMVPISAGVFIFDSVRGNYVYGGTYREYMPLMAQYKMQMEMIEETKKRGLNLYDFGGISGNFTPGTENYGVYEFKRGFGGYVVEYIGEFDLIISKTFYLLYKISFKLYRTFKHIISKFKN